MLVKKFMIGGVFYFIFCMPWFCFHTFQSTVCKLTKYIWNIAYCTSPFFFLVTGCCGVSSLCLPADTTTHPSVIGLMPLQQSSLLYEIKKGKDKESRNCELETMRPRDGPTRRPGGEWPSMCDFVRDGRAVPPDFSVPYRLPWQELHSCELMEFPAAVIL